MFNVSTTVLITAVRSIHLNVLYGQQRYWPIVMGVLYLRAQERCDPGKKPL